MIIREAAYARSGLVGNPSDIFNGKTISFLFDAFKVEVVLYETPQLHIVPNQRDITRFTGMADLVDYRRRYGYYGGIRLVKATISGGPFACTRSMPNCRISYCSSWTSIRWTCSTTSWRGIRRRLS